ncbi:MAG TPA: alpha/beta hydrolase [Tardiphaga sp.]
MSFFEHSDGTRAAFDITGNGPPLLLIHGAEGSRRSFDRLVPMLSDQFTVIVYDQRDCGETVNAAESSDLRLLAADVAELLQGTGYSPAHVFGTSFGGRVAQAVALLHAQAVKSLVLASTWPLPLSLRDLNGEVAVEMVRLRDRLPESAERLAEYFFPPAFLSEYPQFRHHFARAPVRSARSDRRAQTVNDQTSLAAGDIAARTLLLAGACDRLVPSALTVGMKNAIRDSESVVLAGVGHITCVQAPAEVADHLQRFLGST